VSYGQTYPNHNCGSSVLKGLKTVVGADIKWNLHFCFYFVLLQQRWCLERFKQSWEIKVCLSLEDLTTAVLFKHFRRQLLRDEHICTTKQRISASFLCSAKFKFKTSSNFRKTEEGRLYKRTYFGMLTSTHHLQCPTPKISTIAWLKNHRVLPVSSTLSTWTDVTGGCIQKTGVNQLLIWGTVGAH